ncbi:MAG: accessory factor UbiK family protein [Xanthomonadales bacterium]|nr:accessory factor UbiK family protein [Xanthomonadales bacterium]NIX11919.1 accessory factor UbiK family protein [Xanthomonadales bacterium]
MIDLGKIDELVTKLGESLPPGAAKLREDMESQFRSVLQKGFEKMELVTREEFGAQAAVLERLRVKLESLERQLEELDSG